MLLHGMFGKWDGLKLLGLVVSAPVWMPFAFVKYHVDQFRYKRANKNDDKILPK